MPWAGLDFTAGQEPPCPRAAAHPDPTQAKETQAQLERIANPKDLPKRK